MIGLKPFIASPAATLVIFASAIPQFMNLSLDLFLTLSNNLLPMSPTNKIDSLFEEIISVTDLQMHFSYF